VSEDRVRQALEQAPVPDERGAAERAWALVERAYDSREPVRWTRRHRGLVVALAATTLATAVLLVAVLTPPGQAVVDRFRDAVGREPSQPGLVELPVAVLAAVEEHHRKPVTELDAQPGIARCGCRVDVGGGEVEPELGRQLDEPCRGPLAQRAPLSGQQHHLRTAHGTQYRQPRVT